MHHPGFQYFRCSCQPAGSGLLQPLQHHPLIRPPAKDRLDDVRRQQRQPEQPG